MQVKFPDGSAREVQDGQCLIDVAKDIGPRLAKATLAAEVDGEIEDLRTPVRDGASIKFLTFEDEGGKAALRHTASHIMAQAVKRR